MMPETQQGLPRASRQRISASGREFSWRSSFYLSAVSASLIVPIGQRNTFAPIEGFGCDARHITSNRSKRGSESCQTPV